MKKLLKKYSALLLVALLVGAAISCPALAFERPEITRVQSWEDMLGWYGQLNTTKMQDCGIEQEAVCAGDVVLNTTPGRVNLNFLKGLRIPAGASLTVDSLQLVLMAGPLGITVEAGGTLRIVNWNPLTEQSLLAQAIWVKKGGSFILENGLTLPEGVVLDENDPPEGSPQPPPNLSTPMPSLPTLQGEILRVSEHGGVWVMLTLPYVDETMTQTVTVERSEDGLVWNSEYAFCWNQDMQEFISGPILNADTLLSRNSFDQTKTFFEYRAPRAGQGFWLRVIREDAQGNCAASDAIWLDELPIGNYPAQNDYEDFDGNRGGGGQGESDRVEQQQPQQPPAQGEAPAPVPTPPPPALAVQTAQPQPTATSSPAPTPMPTPQPTQAPAQPEEVLEAMQQQAEPERQAEPAKSPGGDLVWVAAGATLAFCAGVGALLHHKAKAAQRKP